MWTSVTTNLFQESILIITLIQNIQEIHFCVLDVSELLWRRGAWGFTLILYMTGLSSPATNVHLRWTFKEIYKGIFCEYMKERDFNASFVITGLLRNQRWQRTLNWYMAWAINQILKSNISVCVFSVERPMLPMRDLINTGCFTQGKSVSVVNTVKRPLPRNLFFSSTHIFTLGIGHMGVKIARIQITISSALRRHALKAQYVNLKNWSKI